MTTIEQANLLYEQGLKAFRSGDNEACIALTAQSLEIGRELDNAALIGQGLMGLCRAALREQNEDKLRALSLELTDLADKTADDWWRVVRAHMNAEMARMNADLDLANQLYDESVRLSKSLGKEGMVATEYFNKSFVAVAQGEFGQAKALIQKHFEIRGRLDQEDVDPYGLIALVNLLAAEHKLEAAAEVAIVCRRLLNENGIIPDPADEEPLQAAEEKIQNELTPAVRDHLLRTTAAQTCRETFTKMFAV